MHDNYLKVLALLLNKTEDYQNLKDVIGHEHFKSKSANNEFIKNSTHLSQKNKELAQCLSPAFKQWLDDSYQALFDYSVVKLSPKPVVFSFRDHEYSVDMKSLFTHDIFSLQHGYLYVAKYILNLSLADRKDKSEFWDLLNKLVPTGQAGHYSWIQEVNHGYINVKEVKALSPESKTLEQISKSLDVLHNNPITLETIDYFKNLIHETPKGLDYVKVFIDTYPTVMENLTKIHDDSESNVAMNNTLHLTFLLMNLSFRVYSKHINTSSDKLDIGQVVEALREFLPMVSSNPTIMQGLGFCGMIQSQGVFNSVSSFFGKGN